MTGGQIAGDGVRPDQTGPQQDLFCKRRITFKKTLCAHRKEQTTEFVIAIHRAINL
jgi:hypothetical protein